MFLYTFSVINTMFAPCTALLYDITVATQTLKLSTTLFCSRNEMAPYFSNRTLEYLRHNLPWDRLILRQTNNPWPSYSQDLNPPDYFVRGYLKEKVCENNSQTREDIIRRKSNGFHKKCSIELWTIIMFELLQCCYTAARCMERT